MSRLKALVLCLAVPLAACSSREDSDWSLVLTMAKDYWNGPAAISLEQAAAIPYATMGVRIGDGPQALFVLATGSGDDLLWVAGQTVAITTRGGRIVRTSGLEHDLTGFSSSTAPPTTEPGKAWASPRAVDWLADFADQGRYSVRISCRRSPPTLETITLLGKPIRTERYDESCEAPAMAWTFVNSFWVSPSSGFVWRSIQHIRPDIDPIELEILRPPVR